MNYLNYLWNSVGSEYIRNNDTPKKSSSSLMAPPEYNDVFEEGCIAQMDTIGDPTKGPYQRYLWVIEKFLNFYSNKIGDILSILDPLTTPVRFLNDLSFFVGTLPNIFDDPEQYRNLIQYAIKLHKIKGTVGALDILFGFIGATVEVIEHPPKVSRYDDDLTRYDDENREYRYDETGCESCSEYSVIITGTEELTPTLIARIIAILDYNEPINLRRRQVTYNLIVIEDPTMGPGDFDPRDFDEDDFLV